MLRTHSFFCSQVSIDSRKTLTDLGKVEKAVSSSRSNFTKGFS